jgi:sugar/nucleoside kinase (ribokinase family)
VVLSAPDDRAMLTAEGTIGDLEASLIDPALIASATHVHAGSFFLQRRLAPQLPELFDRAHAAGATTSLDPNWDPTGVWDGGLLDLLPSIDVFMPNAMEAMRLARISDLEEAIARLRARSPMVVVKRGDHGAVAASAGGMVAVPALPTDVVDTTGAGDSFGAGFLSAFLAGDPIERCLALGNACGALSLRAAGGTEGQATMEEALAAIERGDARGHPAPSPAGGAPP